MAEPHRFFTQAVGRLISGSPSEKRTRDWENKPIAEEDQMYEIGVAFPKGDPDIERILTEIYQYAAGCWAHNQAKIDRLNHWWHTKDAANKGGASMKIVDGDKPNSEGNFNENAAGCWVFYMASKYPIKTAVGEAFAECDPSAVKRGYFIRVSGNIKDNEKQLSQMGVYLNVTHIQLMYEGEEIIGGVDVATAFQGAGTPAQMPAGAKPIGSNFAGNAPPAPPQPQYAPAPPQTAPATMPGHPTPPPPAAPMTASPSNLPGVPQPPQQAAPPQPHPQILQPPAAPAPQQAAPPQPPLPPGVPQ